MKKLISIMLVLSLVVGCSNDEDDYLEEVESEGLDGTWSGQIETPPVPLEIIVKFSNEGEWTGSISIPVQNISDFPLSNLTREGLEISFDMVLPNETISFEGELGEDELIEGTFTQQGFSFPFQLAKGTSSEQDEEDVTYLSVETEHGTLRGELVVPVGVEEYPVVLIIPGSGPTDRNGNSPALPGQNNSLKLLAEALAEEGIASVRYSKRGAGENLDAAIPEEDVRFEHFINDAVVWLDMIQDDDQFTNVGVIGHSQGALVGMLAAKETGVDAYVSIAGTGKPMDEVLLEQLSVQLPSNLLEEAEEILASLNAGETVDDVSQELQSVFRPQIQQFLISWIAYNPVEEISTFDAPTLIVQGTHDIQVSEEQAQLLHEAKGDSELLMIEGMNHVLKDAPADETGNLQTYMDPDIPLAEGLVSGITQFLDDVDFVQ